MTYDYIIVGGGLCGLYLAKELEAKKADYVVLEKGRFLNTSRLGTVRYASTFYDRCALSKSNQGIIIYRSFNVGGTSVISCSNAVDPNPEFLKRIGLQLDNEIAEVKKECGVEATDKIIGKTSRFVMNVSNELGYDMKPMPKFKYNLQHCHLCGRCELGCRYDAKWTGLNFLPKINKERILTSFHVKRVLMARGKAIGVEGMHGLARRKIFAKKIILCAGGLGSPVILEESGVEAGRNLFVDLFTMIYGLKKNSNQMREIPMSIVCDKFHKEQGFILSPFIDNIVGFASIVGKKQLIDYFKRHSLIGIMVKINDDNIGRVYKNGRIDKKATVNDLAKLNKGSAIAREIIEKCGAVPKSIFNTKLRGAHPGGTAAIGKVVGTNLETRIKDLFVCDSSVLSLALGIPPILTLLALTKNFSSKLREK